MPRDPDPRKRRRSRPLTAAALLAASVAVGVVSSTSKGREIDEAAFARANGNHTPQKDRIFSALTELGSIWAAGAAAGVLALTGHRRTAARAFAAASATWFAGQALKKAVMRPRPYDAGSHETRLMIERPSGSSWPSSHPAVILSFVLVASRDLELHPVAREMLGILANAVGSSRTYLGVHYPSDVAGGLLLGRAVGLAWPLPDGTSEPSD
jgi:undecaprenyl-diphosphatase